MSYITTMSVADGVIMAADRQAMSVAGGLATKTTKKLFTI
jgi:hypothetical protein